MADCFREIARVKAGARRPRIKGRRNFSSSGDLNNASESDKTQTCLR
jgi:hypothetical protein